jgi:type I restriction enzyme S subunit
MSEVIPEGWKFAPLGEYAKLQGGNAFKSEQFAEIGIPLIRISNIKSDGRVDLSETVHYKESPSLDKFKVFYGDVLLAMSGATTGKIGTYKSKQCSYLNQRVGRFCPNEQKLHSIFLSQIVQGITFSKQVLIDAIGGAQPNISSSQVEKIFFCFPPLPEQKKIASILTSVDEVIENTQKQIDKLQDLKKATMNELLTKGIGHTEFKDSELGRIPKSWEVKRFKEIILSSNQGVNTTTEKMSYSTHGIKACRSNNIDENCFDWTDEKFVSQETYDSLNDKVKPDLNDVLYCNIGSNLGASSVVNFNDKFMITWNVLRIKIDEDLMTPIFLSHYLNSNRDDLKGIATESTMPFISSKVLALYKFRIPTLPEQIKISSIIEGTISSVIYLETKLAQTQALKKSLMQDLLTGKKRVQVN